MLSFFIKSSPRWDNILGDIVKLVSIYVIIIKHSKIAKSELKEIQNNMNDCFVFFLESCLIFLISGIPCFRETPGKDQSNIVFSFEYMAKIYTEF